MAAALLRHAAQNDVTEVSTTPFGRTYVVEGRLPSPDGRDPWVRAVWFAPWDLPTPRFVTAYPLQRGKG